jgi:hypothetical protein
MRSKQVIYWPNFVSTIRRNKTNEVRKTAKTALLLPRGVHVSALTCFNAHEADPTNGL